MAPPVVAAVEAVQAMGDPPGRLIAPDAPGATARPGVGSASWPGSRDSSCSAAVTRGSTSASSRRSNPSRCRSATTCSRAARSPAMVVIDAVMRLVPGVLGDAESAVDESFGPDGGLEYPTTPAPASSAAGRSPKSSSAATTPRSPAGGASTGDRHSRGAASSLPSAQASRGRLKPALQYTGEDEPCRTA